MGRVKWTIIVDALAWPFLWLLSPRLEAGGYM